MERFKKMLPALLLILFEIAVGVLLLIDAERFTTVVFIAFGCLLILCAALMLVRWLKERRAAEKAKAAWKRAIENNKDSKNDNAMPPEVSSLPLVAVIVTFIFGAVFAFGSAALYNMMRLPIIFYGAIMIVKGIVKIADFISLTKADSGVSVLRLIVGILSVALGVVLIVFSSGALTTMFIITAISLLAEAALDIVTLLLGRRIAKQTTVDADAVETADEEE